MTLESVRPNLWKDLGRAELCLKPQDTQPIQFEGPLPRNLHAILQNSFPLTTSGVKKKLERSSEDERCRKLELIMAIF